MSKVWSFGCSHSAGHELGTGIDKAALTDWYKKYTIGDNFITASKTKNYDKIVLDYWNNPLKNPHNHELAFPGVFARELGLELVAKGKSGVGIDHVMKIYYKFKDQIAEDDIVLFEIPPIYRYIDILGVSRQMSLFKGNELSSPSTFTLELLSNAVIKMLHYEHHNVYLVDVGAGIEKPIVKEYLLTSTTMRDIEFEMYNQEIIRYPMGHYMEEIHEAFGKLLVKEYEQKS